MPDGEGAISLVKPWSGFANSRPISFSIIETLKDELRPMVYHFFFLEGNISSFINENHPCHLGQQNVWVAEHPLSTPRNLKYKVHVLLTYAQPYYLLSSHESIVID